MTKIIFKMDSVEFLAPEGFLERVELPVDGEAIDAPVFENHKRGKNWASILIGKNAANMDRRFLPQRGRVIDVSALNRGTAIEIAGDYVSSGGNPSQDRWIGVVVEKTEDLLIVDRYKTVAKAMSAANKQVLSAVVPDDEDAEILAEMADPGPLTVNPQALAASVEDLETWLKLIGESDLVRDDYDNKHIESIALVLHELKRMKATHEPATA